MGIEIQPLAQPWNLRMFVELGSRRTAASDVSWPPVSHHHPLWPSCRYRGEDTTSTPSPAVIHHWTRVRLSNPLYPTAGILA